jgi:hypothetical protein
MKCDSWASLLARTFASLSLSREPKPRVATNVVFGKDFDLGTCGSFYYEWTLQQVI